MAASGVLIAQEFEKAVAAMPGNLRLSEGLWGRYLRGEVAPQGSAGKEGQSLVLRIDRALPGTAAIFYHPVWEVLDFPRLIGPDQLRSLYLTMARDVWLGMVDLSAGDEPVLRKDAFHFWRNRLLRPDQSMRIRAMATLDGIAAGLIECRMGFFAQNRTDCLNALADVLIHFMKAKKGPGQFDTPRMQSALLLMKGIVLQELVRLMVDPPAVSDEDRFTKRVFSNSHDIWESECDKHQQNLPRHMVVTFRRWRKQVSHY